MAGRNFVFSRRTIIPLLVSTTALFCAVRRCRVYFNDTTIHIILQRVTATAVDGDFARGRCARHRAFLIRQKSYVSFSRFDVEILRVLFFTDSFENMTLPRVVICFLLSFTPTGFNVQTLSYNKLDRVHFNVPGTV